MLHCIAFALAFASSQMIVAIASVKKWDVIAFLLIALFGHVNVNVIAAEASASATTEKNNNDKKKGRRTQWIYYPLPSPTYRAPFPTLRPPTEWPTAYPQPTPPEPTPKAYVEDPYVEDPYYMTPRLATPNPTRSPTMNPTLSPKLASTPKKLVPAEPSTEPTTFQYVSTAPPIDIITNRNCRAIPVPITRSPTMNPTLSPTPAPTTKNLVSAEPSIEPTTLKYVSTAPPIDIITLCKYYISFAF